MSPPIGTRLQTRDGFKRAVAAERRAGVSRTWRRGSADRPSFRDRVNPELPDVRRLLSRLRIAGMTLWSRKLRGRRAARGGSAMDDKGRDSGHLMLITPERVFYAGLLGRPRRAPPGRVPCLCRDQGRPVACDRRRPQSPWRTGRGAAECAAHHRERPSLRDLPRDRAGNAFATARSTNWASAAVGRGARGFRRPHSRGLRAVAAAALPR